MPIVRTPVVVGALTLLEAGCLLGVCCLGRAAVPTATLAPAPVVEPGSESSPGFGPATEVQTLTLAAPEGRAPLASIETAGLARAARPPRTESEFLRELLARTAGDAAALEASARSALAGDGSDVEKVAALRALAETRSPAADELLASAVANLADRSGPDGESVPRFALRLLAERAPREARARTELLRLAYGPRLERTLRATAAAAYSLAADEQEIRGLGVQLATETDPLVRASALEALGRNPRTAAADEVFSRLGAERTVPEEQE